MPESVSRELCQRLRMVYCPCSLEEETARLLPVLLTFNQFNALNAAQISYPECLYLCAWILPPVLASFARPHFSSTDDLGHSESACG